jgi:nucleoside-diphosphate-sugar epimerase
MRILVTGGAGFIGSHLVDALVARGDTVVVYDNLAQGTHENLRDVLDRVAFVPSNLADLDALERAVREHRIERIAHVGAIASRGVLDPSLIIRVNIEGTVNVLEVARRHGLARVVLLSSDEVYGTWRYDPADEGHPLAPKQPYGISKLAGERFAEYYHEFHGVSAVCIRPARVYGPRYRRERVPTPMIQHALQGRPYRLAKGGADRADYTYVRDAVQGIRLALDAVDPPSLIYNITGGKAYSTAEIAAILTELLPGAVMEIGPGPTEVDGIALPIKGALDITRAKRELGYMPQYDIRKGLAENIAHLRSHAV